MFSNSARPMGARVGRPLPTALHFRGSTITLRAGRFTPTARVVVQTRHRTSPAEKASSITCLSAKCRSALWKATPDWSNARSSLAARVGASSPSASRAACAPPEPSSSAIIRAPRTVLRRSGTKTKVGSPCCASRPARDAAASSGDMSSCTGAGISSHDVSPELCSRYRNTPSLQMPLRSSTGLRRSSIRRAPNQSASSDPLLKTADSPTIWVVGTCRNLARISSRHGPRSGSPTA